VGDTVGAPGLMRGLRAALIYEGFAPRDRHVLPGRLGHQTTPPHDHLHPHLTAVEPRLKVYCCCHEVFGTQELLAEWAAREYGVPAPPRQQIRVNVLGINTLPGSTALSSAVTTCWPYSARRSSARV
jgi:alpha-galactosidase